MMKVGKTIVILKEGDSVVSRLSGSGVGLNVALLPGSFLLFGLRNEARLNVTAGSNL